MLKIILIVLMVFSLQNVLSQEIKVDIPEQIMVEEEFEIILNLENFEEDIYDVKIDIFGKGKRISKIFDDVWKSSFYYIKDSIKDKQGKFLLKIESFVGKANIIIKIRNSNGYVESFEGYEIIIKEDLEIKEDEEKDNEKKTIEKKEILTEDKIEIKKENPKNQELKPIILNTKNIKTEDYTNISRKNKYAVYGFIGFCIFIISLFIIKKNKFKNEFE